MKKLSLLFLTVLVFASCKKDLDNIKKLEESEAGIVDWEPTLVAPLINTRTTLGEVYTSLDTVIEKLKDENMSLELLPDGTFNFNYFFDYKTSGINDYYVIPREQQVVTFNVPDEAKQSISTLPVGASLDNAWDSSFVFDIDPEYGAELEYAELGAGKLDLVYTHNFNQDVGVEIKIKSLVQHTTRDTLIVQLSNANPILSIDLKDYDMVLTGNDENGQPFYNKLRADAKMIGQITNNTLSGDFFTLDISMGDYYMNYVQGYLGIFDAKLQSSVEKIDVFDDIDLSGIKFGEPKLKFEMQSTIGMPMQLRVDTLEFGYPNGPSRTLGIDGRTAIAHGVDDRADIPNSPKITVDSIDHNNSDLEDILTSEPNSVKYAIKMVSDDVLLNGATKYSFFIEDTSRMRIKGTASLPLVFSVQNYEYRDTFDIDSLIAKVDQDTIKKIVKRAELKLIFETQLPFDVDVQGILVDKNGVELARIFPNGPHKILANNDRAADGSINSVQESLTYINIDQALFDKFVDAKDLIIVGQGKTSQASTTQDNYVRLKSNYVFGVRAGILAELKVNLNELD
jgi:hypothetical protein